MHSRRFRFGVMYGGTESARAWRAKVRKAEDLGFDVALLPNHPVHQALAPIPALTMAAEATSRLRVGTLVLDNDLTHPALLANDLATLDLLSDGRLEVGLGTGWLAADYDVLGIPFDPAPVRLARLEDAIGIMKRLWAGETVTHASDHYRVSSMQGVPLPVQRPHPPLLIGGGGRRVLELAARHATIVGIAANMRSGKLGRDSAATSTPAATREKVGWIRCAAGDRFNDLELQVIVSFVQVDDDVDTAAARVGRMYDLPEEQTGDVVHALFGPREQMVDRLLARREEHGVSYVTVSEAAVDDFAPVVAALSGR